MFAQVKLVLAVGAAVLTLVFWGLLVQARSEAAEATQRLQAAQSTIAELRGLLSASEAREKALASAVSWKDKEVRRVERKRNRMVQAVPSVVAGDRELTPDELQWLRSRTEGDSEGPGGPAGVVPGVQASGAAGNPAE